MDKKVTDILAKMTLAEKISLCNGADFWHSKAMEKYSIPAITMSDGPHGVRCQKNAGDMLGAIDRALGAYANRDFFAELRQRCMAEDFSWGRSANEYIRMYRELIKG